MASSANGTKVFIVQVNCSILDFQYLFKAKIERKQDGHIH
jgi:hypothetical protein